MDYLKDFKELMFLRNMSQKTTDSYVSNLKMVSQFIRKELNEITEHDIRKYLLSKKHLSSSSRMAVINAFKAFYKLVMGRGFDHAILPRPKVEQKQPDILSTDEISMMLKRCANIKHKAIIALMYSCALRVGEVVNLKVKDIDSSNQKINIKNGKGKIDRVVMLDEKLLYVLREYYQVYKTKEYLFEGNKGGKYSDRSIQSIIKKTVKACGIEKNISSHSMRHSCLTQLVKDGVDLRSVQKLAGHKNINTTAGYIKMVDADVLGIVSPLSKINIL
jgi:site-specific recombinase XerD